MNPDANPAPSLGEKEPELTEVMISQGLLNNYELTDTLADETVVIRGE